MSKPIVTVDNLNADHFSLDTENRKINIVVPEVEVIASLESEETNISLAASQAKELKDYIDIIDNSFLGMMDAFNESIYSSAITPTTLVVPITHSNGSVTYRAKAEAPDNTFYELDGEWYYIVGDDSLETLTYQYKDLEGVTPTLSLTDANDVSQEIPLRNIVTTKVTNMSSLFASASNFNQDISTWDTSSVSNMSNMFNGADQFNQNITNWDVSNVVSMDTMFRNASVFNQDLSSWCVANITSEPTFFSLNANGWTLPRPVWGACP